MSGTSPFPSGPPPARPPEPAWQPPPYGAAGTGHDAGPPDAAVESEGLAYHLLLRGGWDGAWWRGLIGLALLGIGMVLVLPLLVLAPFVVYYWAAGADVEAATKALVDLRNPTPASLAYLNLTLAGLIPVTWMLVRWLHGLRPRWLSSVRPRLRWRYLLACVGLSVVALLATIAVGALLPASAMGAETGGLNPWTDELRDFALVVLLLTPLQAAAEEYAFRGYLLQAFGGFVRHPAFAVGLSSLLFALAHGAQDLPVFFDRFAFGAIAGILVIVTGGLEAGIAMHVLNNWLAFGIALAYSDLGSALNPTGGSWWSIPVTLTQSLVYLALAWWVARRMGLARRSDPAVLAARSARV